MYAGTPILFPRWLILIRQLSFNRDFRRSFDIYICLFSHLLAISCSRREPRNHPAGLTFEALIATLSRHQKI